jgi:hypothetical protein
MILQPTESPNLTARLLSNFWVASAVAFVLYVATYCGDFALRDALKANSWAAHVQRHRRQSRWRDGTCT